MRKGVPVKTPLPEPIGAFVAGATEPSVGSIAIMLLVFGLMAVWTIGKAGVFVAEQASVLATDDGDDYPFVTAATLRLASAESGERGAVILGASCLRGGTDEKKSVRFCLRQIPVNVSSI
tara:strand:- start:736 stop:1095 length:360 start_codon:yes stop_codon:yes gene_type:complete